MSAASKYHPVKKESSNTKFPVTKGELKKLADDLSKGVYKKESKQREEILQMIAEKLSDSPESPP